MMAKQGYLTFDEAVEKAMKELGWTREKAIEEILVAMDTGELQFKFDDDPKLN